MPRLSDDVIIKRAMEIMERKLIYGDLLNSPINTTNYLRARLHGKQIEEFHVLYLNSQLHIITAECAASGTISAASIYPREIVKAVLRHNAASVILAHNHPSGKNYPSKADKIITNKLVKALETIDVKVLDHIVISDGELPYSFAENGLL